MRTEGVFSRLWKWSGENLSFLAVLATTFLALLLLIVISFGSFYQSAREDAVTIGSMTVKLEAQRIEDALYSGMNTLLVSGFTVDSMLEAGATPLEIENYARQETNGIISGINPDFSGIYGVIDGVYIDGVGWQPEAGYDPYSRPWYLAAAEKKGELAIVSPYVDAQTNTVTVSFSKLLSDGRSAISLDIQLDNIYEATEAIQLMGSGYCFLVDMAGQVIAHRDGSQVGKNYLEDAEFAGSDIRALVESISVTGGSKPFREALIEGRRCMVFVDSVHDTWNIVLVVGSSDLFKDTQESLARSILVSLAIFALVGYFCTSNYQNKKRALRYAAEVRTDDLTGLNNRGEFDRYLSVAVSSVLSEQGLYLLLFDADDFKSVNDTLGHQEGDRALRLIAKALMQVCHGTDWFCARYGGDEFVIVCRCADDAAANQIIADMNSALDALAGAERLPYRLSVSGGYARYDEGMLSLSDFVDAADQRLYSEKARRRE